ncbi:MAG: HEAT repeat domain-containing protein [Planctomycetia bacterium]|nr:HEAT repeat domain-containing protein [Planctomycetia bacterium]
MRTLGPIVLSFGIALWGGSPSRAQEADVANLIAALDGESRTDAVDTLARLGPRAKTAVPALTKALADEDVEVRWRSARALGAMGGAAAAAVPSLVEHLADPEAAVRAQSAAALGKIGVKDAAAVTALTKVVADPEPRVRRSAIQALVRAKPDPKVLIPLLLSVVEDSQPEVAMPAMAALADMGEQAVVPLVASMKDRKARYWAALVLAELGPKAKAAVPALQKLTDDAEPEVRMQALITLGQIGPAAASAVPAMTKALEAPEPAVRYGAAFALGKLKAQDAAPALEALVDSKDPTLQLVASWAIARINPKNPMAVARAIDAITDSIRSDDPQLSRTAARALAELDVPAETIEPAIRAALDEMDPTVLEHVMDALAAVGEKAVPVLVAGLKDPKQRDPAIRALGRIGPAAQAAVPALAALVSSADLVVVRDAAAALGAIGPSASKAVPSITALLGKSDSSVGYAAAIALGKIGPAAKSAVPQLLKQINAKEPLLTVASVWAVRRLDPGNKTVAPAAVPVLTGALASKQEIMRAQAAAALGDLGPAARDAIPALKKLSDDPQAEVRRAATDALAKIQGTRAGQ